MSFRLFTPEAGKRFSRFDIWVYALFEKRWTPHFRNYPDLRKDFIKHMQEWDTQRASQRAELTLVKPPESVTD